MARPKSNKEETQVLTFRVPKSKAVAVKFAVAQTITGLPSIGDQIAQAKKEFEKVLDRRSGKEQMVKKQLPIGKKPNNTALQPIKASKSAIKETKKAIDQDKSTIDSLKRISERIINMPAPGEVKEAGIIDTLKDFKSIPTMNDHYQSELNQIIDNYKKLAPLQKQTAIRKLKLKYGL